MVGTSLPVDAADAEPGAIATVTMAICTGHDSRRCHPITGLVQLLIIQVLASYKLYNHSGSRSKSTTAD